MAGSKKLRGSVEVVSKCQDPPTFGRRGRPTEGVPKADTPQHRPGWGVLTGCLLAVCRRGVGLDERLEDVAQHLP